MKRSKFRFHSNYLSRKSYCKILSRLAQLTGIPKSYNTFNVFLKHKYL